MPTPIGPFLLSRTGDKGSTKRPGKLVNVVSTFTSENEMFGFSVGAKINLNMREFDRKSSRKKDKIR